MNKVLICGVFLDLPFDGSLVEYSGREDSIYFIWSEFKDKQKNIEAVCKGELCVLKSKSGGFAGLKISNLSQYGINKQSLDYFSNIGRLNLFHYLCIRMPDLSKNVECLLKSLQESKQAS